MKITLTATAVVADAIAVYFGFMLAFWIRFDSGWIKLFHAYPPKSLYNYGALLAAFLFIIVIQGMQLYQRPQLGSFSDKIPRLTRATLIGMLFSVALWFMIRTTTPFARIFAALSFFTVLLVILIERFVLFQLEIQLAQRQPPINKALILGSDTVAMHLKEALESEPRLRTTVAGFLDTSVNNQDHKIPEDLNLGHLGDLNKILETGEIDRLILTDSTLSRSEMINIILSCEQNLVKFELVPDIFRILTSVVSVQNIAGVPLLGVGRWPLDHFWNRFAKRTEDIFGSILGLLIASPVILICGILIKLTSRGPIFYHQERCGENGHTFVLHKLRTMKINAEEKTGPVWTTEEDARRTKLGEFLRSNNLDELPQFWNVLKGDMSLVGPRPERPHFVKQFKTDINRYMSRHISKPGITGWAQVNGLRGDTDLQERIKYDLYYLENWSLAFDFKILAKTIVSRKNAY